MDIRKLQRAIVDGLEDVKAQKICVFNTEHLSPLFERVIVASGASNRQTKALAASVRDRVRSGGMQVLRTEGEGNGEWVIVDCGAAVVHIMQPDIRDYYNLEEIWGDKPVKMKLDTSVRLLPKAAPAKPSTAAKSAPRKAAPKKAVAKKFVVKKTPAKPVAKTASPKKAAATKRVTPAAAPRKAASAKAPAARAPAKAVVSRTVGVKKAPAKSVAKKPVAKKVAPARRK